MNEDFGLNWYAYGARYYDPVLGRFTGVDPISDQFPHVSTYNYAENSPIANIDLHGLQKYFASDGKFIKKNGQDNSIRILTTPPNKHGFGPNYKMYSASELNSVSTPGYKSNEKNKDSAFRRWAKKYQRKSNRYSNDPGGDREFAMALYSQKLTDEDGSTFEAFVEGETIEGRKGVDGISLADSESPIEGWEMSEVIHSHRWGGDPVGFSEGKGYGGLLKEDIPIAIKLGITSYLVVPGSDYIGSFDPKVFNEKKQEDYSDEQAIRAAKNGRAIRIQ